jgi:hypothetical protein
MLHCEINSLTTDISASIVQICKDKQVTITLWNFRKEAEYL